jgi:EpsI family protein
MQKSCKIIAIRYSPEAIPEESLQQEHSRRQTIEISALVVLMLIVGGLGWSLRGAPDLVVDTLPLSELPHQIGRWQAMDIPMEPAVENELRADYNLQRVYATRSEAPLWLYVGYYGTLRGGRPEHTPRGCYTGAGWGIEASRTIEIDSDGILRANEYLVEQNGERRLVQFWYRSHRRTGILGGLDQNIDRLLGRLIDGRADGALVRISTPIQRNDTVAARGRLISFASSLDPLLGEYWPDERSRESELGVSRTLLPPTAHETPTS